MASRVERLGGRRCHSARNTPRYGGSGDANDTSSGLFTLAARIAGPPSAELDHLARHAGLAFGFVQAINAVPRDAARRQLFVPLQLLEKHGSGMEQVLAGKQTPQARAGIDELIASARQHFETALALVRARKAAAAGG